MPVAADVPAPEGWSIVAGGCCTARPAGQEKTEMPCLKRGCWQLVFPYCLTVTTPQHQREKMPSAYRENA